jgi:hypothetical protein
MERRAINSILLDELQKIKGTNEIIEIKLQDNELFRISSEVDPVMYGHRVLWIITHALPSGRRYFSDTYSDSIGVILNIISQAGWRKSMRQIYLFIIYEIYISFLDNLLRFMSGH